MIRFSAGLSSTFTGTCPGKVRATVTSTAAAVLAECREEIEVRRRFGDWYGYAFFIARKH